MKSRNVARPCDDQRVAEQSCTAGFALDASVWAIITHAAASDDFRVRRLRIGTRPLARGEAEGSLCRISDLVLVRSDTVERGGWDERFATEAVEPAGQSDLVQGGWVRFAGPHGLQLARISEDGEVRPIVLPPLLQAETNGEFEGVLTPLRSGWLAADCSRGVSARSSRSDARARNGPVRTGRRIRLRGRDRANRPGTRHQHRRRSPRLGARRSLTLPTFQPHAARDHRRRIPPPVRGRAWDLPPGVGGRRDPHDPDGRRWG